MLMDHLHINRYISILSDNTPTLSVGAMCMSYCELKILGLEICNIDATKMC